MTDKDDPRGRSALDDLRIVDPGALKGDPFAPKANLFTSLFSSGRGWVAAVIAVGVLFLAYRFSAPVSEQVAGTTAATTPAAPASVQMAPERAQPAAPAQASGPVKLQAADPAALKAQIVEDFRSVGVEAIGYDRLGLSGVDAPLPSPLPEPVRAVLERYRIPVPADGVVRVEIAPSK